MLLVALWKIVAKTFKSYQSYPQNFIACSMGCVPVHGLLGGTRLATCCTIMCMFYILSG